MQHYPCDRCNKEIIDSAFVTIPLDPEYRKTSGMYCSANCAIWDNRMVNRPMRGVEGWEQREQWMRREECTMDPAEKRNK